MTAGRRSASWARHMPPTPTSPLAAGLLAGAALTGCTSVTDDAVELTASAN